MATALVWREAKIDRQGRSWVTIKRQRGRADSPMIARNRGLGDYRRTRPYFVSFADVWQK